MARLTRLATAPDGCFHVLYGVGGCGETSLAWRPAPGPAPAACRPGGCGSPTAPRSTPP
ncbi:hypothetical protein [Streptomyces flavofungini]|uniref:hypothetical protein n=1 Tax=Streptomyces flavofungini TaxID=68200 RepID=UPI0025B2760E|nr:hypothetical protein [Streptomyces flavofungini]WJV44296.1 hypothetical protein QUY26_01320 [Streptomyces flavofungini]